MDALKALVASKRKAADEVYGGKKYIKRGQIEEARLRKLREEEAQELAERAARREAAQSEQKAGESEKAARKKEAEDAAEAAVLTPAEVVRRLRLLAQPATLFGENDFDRLKRLKKAEETLQLEDEEMGGQQDNTLLALQRMERATTRGGGGGGGGAVEKKEGGKEGGGGEGGDDEDEDPTLAAFKRAAEAVKVARMEETMSVDERLRRCVKRWCEEWRVDMDARSEDVKQSVEGRQATMLFKQTMEFLDPLQRQLREGSLDEELMGGLWLMVQAMRDRNYLAAYDIYMKIAIGNAPWPIGVTMVGIHERSAREKISHAMNEQHTAHIMTTEATRRYLQGLKRLMTFVQRAYPTAPSRSVDFGAFRDPGRGAIGNGSDKQALLEMHARGAQPRLALPAPSYVDADGSIRPPKRWEAMKRDTDAAVRPKG